MRHLFIINPVCAKLKDKSESTARDIREFMESILGIHYDIHVSRWSRDALGYCRRYVLNAGGETVRVHTLGGSSTYFEIINAVVDLPNAQVALYPMGNNNMFLNYFGKKKIPLFASVKNQVFADVCAVDAIRCNHDYGISSVLMGYEAYIDNEGDKFMNKFRLSNGTSYTIMAVKNMFARKISQNYEVKLDGQILDGEYSTIMASNQPWYNARMHPGSEAHPNSGRIEVYLGRDPGLFRRALPVISYLSGKYYKYPNIFSHRSGRCLEVSSNEIIWLSVDGEAFYGNNIQCEIVPGAIMMTCPDGVRGEGLL